MRLSGRRLRHQPLNHCFCPSLAPEPDPDPLRHKSSTHPVLLLGSAAPHAAVVRAVPVFVVLFLGDARRRR